jgi:3-oxoacyl-[acyl-carrier-protein] synthase II
VKRAVVTGMGVVSPLGNTVHDFSRGLLQGRSGIAALDDIELGKLPTRIGARAVGYDARDYFDHQEAHRMSRASQMSVIACEQSHCCLMLDQSQVPRALTFLLVPGLDAPGPTKPTLVAAVLHEQRNHGNGPL